MAMSYFVGVTPTCDKLAKCAVTARGMMACLQNGILLLGWREFRRMRLLRVAQLIPGNCSKNKRCSVKSNLDGGIGDPFRNGARTRLFKTLQIFRVRLGARIEELRKDFPMKVLFFLAGFYCATAFATVIGQTGDWDILSAGLAVVVVEGIGVLMYRTPFPLLDKMKNLIPMFNYWKAGLSLVSSWIPSSIDLPGDL